MTTIMKSDELTMMFEEMNTIIRSYVGQNIDISMSISSHNVDSEKCLTIKIGQLSELDIQFKSKLIGHTNKS